MRGHPTIAPWQDGASNPSRAGTYLAARVLYPIGLAPTIRGREQQTLALFNEVLGYCTMLRERGETGRAR
jgi:hypothetical protein